MRCKQNMVHSRIYSHLRLIREEKNLASVTPVYTRKSAQFSLLWNRISVVWGKIGKIFSYVPSYSVESEMRKFRFYQNEIIIFNFLLTAASFTKIVFFDFLIVYTLAVLVRIKADDCLCLVHKWFHIQCIPHILFSIIT